MTLKITQGHRKWRFSISFTISGLYKRLYLTPLPRHYHVYSVCYVTGSGCEPVTFRSPLVFVQLTKLQVIYALIFACKHNVANTFYIFRDVTFGKISTAKITFKVIQVHR